jgi:hypothetical protein
MTMDIVYVRGRSDHVFIAGGTLSALDVYIVMKTLFSQAQSSTIRLTQSVRRFTIEQKVGGSNPNRSHLRFLPELSDTRSFY